MLWIMRGAPSDEELAALTAVLAAAASHAVDAALARPRSAWGDPARRMRVPLRPGPGAWRASAMAR